MKIPKFLKPFLIRLLTELLAEVSEALANKAVSKKE